MEVFTGTISIFGFNFPPRNWNTCSGQILSINQYSALFSLLNTTFGGDGRATFGLPDLRGRLPLGMGTALGGAHYNWGQRGGQDAVYLQTPHLPVIPPHSHQASVDVQHTSPTVQVSTNDSGNATAPSAANSYLSASGSGTGSATIWSSSLDNPVSLGGVQESAPTAHATVEPAVAFQGGGVAVPVMNPYLSLNFCIAMDGLYPPRS